MASSDEREPIIAQVRDGKLNTEEVRAMVRELTDDAELPMNHFVGRQLAPARPPTRHQAAPPLARAMQRDVTALRTVLARLHQLLPALAAADRAALVLHLKDLAAEIDAMCKNLEQDQSPNS